MKKNGVICFIFFLETFFKSNFLKLVPVMLDECLDYLERRAKDDSHFTYEVLIVDDGSRDKTTEVALGYSLKFGSDKVRVLTLMKNRGKGGAVRLVTAILSYCPKTLS